MDGDTLSFSWSLTSVPVGSAAMLSDATALSPTSVVDVPGSYIAQLIVNDGLLSSSPTTTTVSVNVARQRGALRVTSARWEADGSKLTVRGDGAPGRAIVTIANADTPAEVLGSATAEDNGKWEAELAGIAVGPCYVRAESAGELAEKSVKKAPSRCKGATPSRARVTIEEASWDAGDAELEVGGSNAPGGATVVVTNAAPWNKCSAP